MRRILGHVHNLAAVSAERQPLGLSDIVPAAVLFVFAWLADSVNRAALPELSDGLPVSDLVVLGATVLPIALRRRFPLSVLTVVTAAFLVCRFEDVPEFTATSLALFIALFAAGAYSRHRMRDVVRGRRSPSRWGRSCGESSPLRVSSRATSSSSTSSRF